MEPTKNVTVFALVYNHLEYTTRFLNSVRESGIPDADVVVVNNGSTDGTAEFLAGRPELRVITLTPNRGFAFAWNQGALASSTTWTVWLQNDVLVAPGLLDGLLAFAEEHRLDAVSPAMCEGDLDYDFPTHAHQFVRTMSEARRLGMAHAVCLMIHRRVFDSIGLLDDDPRLLGYQDDEFFRRMRRGGFRTGITGKAFLHHFGSITVKSIKAHLKQSEAVYSRDRDYYRQKYKLNWVRRRREQIRERILTTFWRQSELWRFGQTLHQKRAGGISRSF
ncbi:MAG: glycosyltransferase family 2 protein [Limisphaerales bacterium]